MAPATASADSGSGSGSGSENTPGSYIMSGLSGPVTTSSDPDSGAASNTRTPNSKSSTAAGRLLGSGLQSDGIWYTLIMAYLSFF